jgi:hypothetical protein
LSNAFCSLSRRQKEEGRRKKEEGRRKKEEGKSNRYLQKKPVLNRQDAYSTMIIGRF